ncbi:hypothetical protein ES703_46434 [subsurface metagenome]
MNIHGNAAPVVFHPDGAVLLKSNHDFSAATSHGFVNAIIDNFIDQMVQSTLVSTADIHAGSTAHCFPPAQNLNIIGGVLIVYWFSRLGHILWHSQSLPP